jgi:endonuclease/exonuclease/phosphatase (EEP) superfamily protein YafD
VKVAIFIAGYLFVLFTLIPLIRSDNWVFRIFEYPRFQKLAVLMIIMTAFTFHFESDNTHDIIFMSAVFLSILYLAWLVSPYTPLAKNQVKRIKHNGENALSLLICNVYQDNRHVKALLNQIKKHDPDLVLMLEVDNFWTNSLEVLHKNYPERLLYPLENTYGMNLYSKFDLVEANVKFLVDKEVPSIHAVVRLPNGERVRLYGLHPQPPVPHENPRSTERDAELLLVAKEAKKHEMPLIVAGDLNDVAWSYTSELFMKISGLLDPRRGRGFFNTFHVKYPMLRWPLDHVFCSAHFQLLHLKRLPDIGSDHFPIFISLALKKEEEKEQSREKLPATKKDKQVADEKTSL